MKLGIVGAGADKFDPITEFQAKSSIVGLFKAHSPTLVCSGHSPVGGIDIWAENLATQYGIPFVSFPAEVNKWDGMTDYSGNVVNKIGFKQRNLQITQNSDLVVCIVVKNYPRLYKGMVFSGCYHCDRNKHKNPPPAHIKSGGCWTAWKCGSRQWIVI